MLKKLIAVSLAAVMAIGMGTVSFAAEPLPGDDYTFEEFSTIVENAFAEEGHTVKITGYDEDVALTQEFLDEWLDRIHTDAPVPVMSVAEPVLVLESEVARGNFSERTYSYYKELTTPGVPGFCEVKVTLEVLLFAGTGELYDVADVSSRKSAGLLANSWNPPDETASIASSYRAVDVDIEGYVEWGYDGLSISSEHTFSHTFNVG